MIDAGELIAGLAEMLGEMAGGIFDSLVRFHDLNSGRRAERNKIQTLGLHAAPQNENFGQKIVEPDRPFDAQMK
jgi:hypothetical protein